MNQDLQDDYALIVNEVGRCIDAAKDDREQEIVALDAVLKLLGNFNSRLTKIEDRIAGRER